LPGGGAKQEPKPGRPRAKVNLTGAWETSAAAFACTTVERQIDSILANVEPDADNRRSITVRELQTLVATPRLVSQSLRVLIALGRWKAVKIPFERQRRVFWRNGYLEAEQWRSFDWWVLDGDWREAVKKARAVAQKVRAQRL
jgi:hypothetical protein